MRSDTARRTPDAAATARTRALCLLILLLPCSASAVTYYVDPNSGRDTWAGTAPAPVGTPATNGPWQTFDRVNEAQPGDSILLKCGAVWNFGLGLYVSGTPAAPITIGAYPQPCATPPAIDGAVTVPASQWVRYKNNIYQTTLPLQSIPNSDFATGLGAWYGWSAPGDHAITTTSVCSGATAPCLSFTSGTGTGSSLAISPSFSIQGGIGYSVTFRMKAPLGVSIKAIVRRAATPWDVLGLSETFVGNGTWQDYSFGFVASSTVGNARLDFTVPPGRVVLQVDEVHVTRDLSYVQQLFIDGQPYDIAHFPNRGYDSTRPDSVYLLSTADSDRVRNGTGTGSSYLAVGSELKLPTGVTLQPGFRIRARPNAWRLDERYVTAVQPGRLVFDSPTTYPLVKGWGYFLLDALWMLDEPGEWYFDWNTQTLYVWMPDGAAPGARVAVSRGESEFYLGGVANIIVDGIALRHVGTGVYASNASSITLRNLQISDTLGDGIDASTTGNSTFEKNSLSRIGTEGIVAGVQATVVSNVLNEIGVRLAGNKVVSLPTGSLAAIRTGQQANVEGNTTRGTGYIGISPGPDSIVRRNAISLACRVLDDCGGIYTAGARANVQIDLNQVTGPGSTPDGKPLGSSSHFQGIYLDNQASGVTVTGNTVSEVDNGIQLHNASSNVITGNTLYGNRRSQLWMQENEALIRPSGDLFGNQIYDNSMFPTDTGVSVTAETTYANTQQFASFDRNRYSALLAPAIAFESGTSGSASYTFSQWQSAKTSNGTPRNLDRNGRVVASVGFATLRVNGQNLLTNGSLSAGLSGWSSWNAVPPYGLLELIASCIPGRCVSYSAGASSGLVATPSFSVTKGSSYRVSFDLLTGSPNQTVSVRVRRAGGGTTDPYEPLAPLTSVLGSPAWQRFAFVFQSLGTAVIDASGSPALGARIDFQGIATGQRIVLSNVQVVPVSPVDASLATRLVSNATDVEASLGCPDATSAPSRCPHFIRFSDGLPAVWPMRIPPRSSEIVYWHDPSLVDSDGDGIGDFQDACAATKAGVTTNASGCGLVP